MRKIAELPTDEGLDVLVEITPYVKTLANNESLIGLFKDLAGAGDHASEAGFAASVLEKLIPIYLKDCRAEMMEIARIINGQTAEEVQKQGAMKTFEDIGLLFQDPDFVSFFKSFVAMTPAE